jgi:hypothetical protein
MANEKAAPKDKATKEKAAPAATKEKAASKEKATGVKLSAGDTKPA